MSLPSIPLPFCSLTLKNLPEQQSGVIRESTNTRPILRLVEENGQRAVVKDFSVNGFFYRNIVGRFLIWREEKAYRKLRGMAGVPKFYRVIDGLAIVFEMLDAVSVEGLENESKLSAVFFEDLRRLVIECHKRGLAHCDLKRAPNTLVGRDGRPYIVDWAAGISERELGFFPLNIAYRKFLEDDLNAVVKIQLRHCPEEVAPEDKTRYLHRGRIEGLIRVIRDSARDMLKRVA